MDNTVSSFSPFAQALIQVYTKQALPKVSGPDKIRVSRTVSAAAFLLEKIRNAVEFREEHLIRRAAIERIIRRRLLMNQEAEGVASYLIRELIWAKYLPSGEISNVEVRYVQETIDKYMKLRQRLLTHVASHEQVFYSNWLLEVAAAEVEERLQVTTERDVFVNFMYQYLRVNITVNNKTNNERDLQVYIAVSKSLAKADKPLLRYQLLKLYEQDIEHKGPEIVPSLLPKISSVIRSIEAQLNHPVGGKLFLYMRRQAPPFYILKDLFDAKEDDIAKILSNKEQRKESIWDMCGQRYHETGKRLQRLAVRSIIYIFITKMVLVLLLEMPVNRMLEGKVDLVALGINVVFPPSLMFAITLTTSPPGEGNTKRIFSRIEELLLQMPKEIDKKIDFNIKQFTIKPALTFLFTLIYGITFAASFGGIIFVLSMIGFSVVSQIVFIFFLTVITFFGYRIRQTAREYRYEDREGIFTPILDLFFIPILQVGRWLSNEVARLNIFTYIFDFFLEIPVKGILELLEEWFSFMRQKREEIT